MSTPIKYFAFISYKREDEKWAKWLQKELEGYHLPTKIAKANPNLPKEIRPIFRDTTELKSGKLKQQIEDALNSSKFLIVICSPLAAQSTWVNKELETFIKKNGVDRIIPFIVEGTALAKNPEEECFPSALINLSEDQELLGANIQEVGKETAMIKAIAQMLDVKFDTLWNRYERTKKRRRFIFSILGTVITLLSIGAASVFANLNHELKKTNNELESSQRIIQYQKDSLISSNNLLREKSDSLQNALDLIKSQTSVIERSNKQLRTSRDSIASQKNLLGKRNEELIDANEQIKIERDNVKAENWRMLENRSRYVSKEIEKLVAEGDSYTARMLLNEIFPTNWEQPEKPITKEAERALRLVSDSHSAILRGHEGEVNNAIYINNEKVLSVGNDQTMRIWDANNGDAQIIRDKQLFLPSELSYNKRNGKIAIVNGRQIQIWDGDSIIDKFVDKGRGDRYSVFARYTPNGLYLFTTKGNNIIVRESDKDSIITSFIAHNKDITSISFSDNSQQLLTTSKDSTIVVWNISDIHDIRQSHILKGHTSWVLYASFNNDGNMIVSSSGDNTIRIWNSDNNYLCIDTLKGHTKDILQANFSPEGRRIVSTSNDNTIRIWDLYYGICVDTISNTTISPSVSFSPNGDKILYTLNNEIRLIDNTYEQFVKKSAQCRGLYQRRNLLKSKYSDGYTTLFNNKGDKYASFFWGNQFTLTDIGTKEKKFFNGHNSTVTALAFSEDDNTIITGDNDGIIRVWNADNGTNIDSFKIAKNFIRNLSFSNNGKSCYICSGNRFKKYNLQKRDVEYDYYVPISDCLLWGNDPIAAYEVDDNNVITISSDEVIRSWNILNNDTVIINNCGNTGLCRTTLSPDKKYLACAMNDKSIKIWNLKLKEYTTIPSAHLEQIQSIDFSNDSKYVITSSKDKTAKIWDISNGLCIYTVSHTCPLTTASISPKNDVLLIGSVILEDLFIDFPPTPSLISRIRKEINNKKFTESEMKKYYLK